MSAKVDIFNLAITLLGGNTIVSTTQNNRAAIAMTAVYDMIRLAELRKHPWNFATKQAQLNANANTPIFDRAYSYPLPSDFVKMMPPFPESNYNDMDWIIQDKQIYTSYQPPLNIRYVADIQDTTMFDPLFVTALAARLATSCADAITQSTGKLNNVNIAYQEAVGEAKKANAIDNVPQDLSVDRWWSVRM